MGNELELLIALLRSKYDEVSEAPKITKRAGRWYELVVGIGNDNVAYVTLTDDALSALGDEQGFDIKELIDSNNLAD